MVQYRRGCSEFNSRGHVYLLESPAQGNGSCFWLNMLAHSAPYMYHVLRVTGRAELGFPVWVVCGWSDLCRWRVWVWGESACMCEQSTFREDLAGPMHLSLLTSHVVWRESSKFTPDRIRDVIMPDIANLMFWLSSANVLKTIWTVYQYRIFFQ